MTGKRRPAGGSRLADLLFGDHADPRPWQAAFALLLALALGLLAAGGAFEQGTRWLVLAGVLAAVVSAGVCYPMALVLEAVETERAEVHHHQQVADAILNTVDVGLVLLDSQGTYVTMNKRHSDFMRLAFPEGHDGRAGALGQVFAEDWRTRLGSEQMPSYRACHGEEFDDCRIWVGDDPLTSRALSVSARTVHEQRGRIAGAALA